MQFDSNKKKLRAASSVARRTTCNLNLLGLQKKTQVGLKCGAKNTFNLMLDEKNGLKSWRQRADLVVKDFGIDDNVRFLFFDFIKAGFGAKGWYLIVRNDIIKGEYFSDSR
jgi:hypothetical protein